MTSLIPPSTSTRGRSASEIRHDLADRRPLALLAATAGVVAAGSTLLVCLGLGVAGWFLSDSGAHGEPRDGLRVGAIGWLTGHGSGVRIEGVPVSAVPLGVTLVCAWVVWRIGRRVGESVSGHGPDAVEIADGQRDWTVPVAAGLFALGYVVVAVVTASVAATASTGLDTTRVVLWSLVLCLGLGAPAIAVGSGRAATWVAGLPVTVRAAAALVRRLTVWWLALSALAFVVSFALDLSTAANVMSQLHTDAGAAALIVGLGLVLLPNAVLCSGSFLMGPGFAVGTGTLVAPSGVVLGPLPAFPVLAALPDEGATPGWTAWLVAVPPVLAFCAAVWCLRRYPSTRFDEGAIRGCAGGIVAGLAFGLLASLAGGAVGPGRMRDIGPFVGDVTLHAVTSFGIGGLLGGLAITWWQRRAQDAGDL